MTKTTLRQSRAFIISMRAKADELEEKLDARIIEDDGRILPIEEALDRGLKLYDVLDFLGEHGSSDISADALVVQQGIQAIRTHSAKLCADDEFCCIHRPSDHGLRSAPMYWLAISNLTVRVCEHGNQHPDPDGLAYLVAAGHARAEDLEDHRCDGCCPWQAQKAQKRSSAGTRD